MSQQIVDLLLRIDAKTETLVRASHGVDRLANSFKGIARFASTFAGINLSAQGLVSTFRTLVLDGIRQQHAFADMADQLETTSEAVQVLDYQFRRMGGTGDDAQRVALQVNKRLAEAAAGSQEAAKYFGDLGLSIEELLAMPVERRLEAMGRQLVRLEGDQTAYNAAAQIAGVRSLKFFEILKDLATGGYDAARGVAEAEGQIGKYSDRLAAIDQRWEDWKRSAQNFLQTIILDASDGFKAWTDTSISQIEKLEARIAVMERYRDRARAALIPNEYAAQAAESDLAKYRAELEALKAAAAPPAIPQETPEEAAARAAKIRNEQAGAWLKTNRERYAEQIQAAQDATISEEQLLAAVERRIHALERAHSAFLLQAEGENTIAKEALEYELERAKLEKQFLDLRERVFAREIAQERARGQLLANSIDLFARNIATAAAYGENLGDAVANAFRQVAAEIAVATLRAVLFRTVMAATGGSGGWLGSILGSLTQTSAGTGYAAGGYTGDGPVSAPAGIVHRREYVTPADVVDRLGVGYFDAVTRAARGRGFASGGFAGDLPALPIAAAARSEALAIHNHFPQQYTPRQLEAVLQEHTARVRNEILDAMRRRSYGFGSQT